MSNLFESYFISYGVLKKYKSLHSGKIRYLAIVIESEDAHQTSKVVQLLKWLDSIGVKNVCLYDMNGMKGLENPTFFLLGPYDNVSLELYILGVLKRSKETILQNLKNAKSIEVHIIFCFKQIASYLIYWLIYVLVYDVTISRLSTEKCIFYVFHINHIVWVNPTLALFHFDWFFLQHMNGAWAMVALYLETGRWCVLDYDELVLHLKFVQYIFSLIAIFYCLFRGWWDMPIIFVDITSKKITDEIKSR